MEARFRLTPRAAISAIMPSPNGMVSVTLGYGCGPPQPVMPYGMSPGGVSVQPGAERAGISSASDITYDVRVRPESELVC